MICMSVNVAMIAVFVVWINTTMCNDDIYLQFRFAVVFIYSFILVWRRVIP